MFQSVRMLTTLKPDRPWRPEETPATTFVVIGRDIDRETFSAGFSACVIG